MNPLNASINHPMNPPPMHPPPNTMMHPPPMPPLLPPPQLTNWTNEEDKSWLEEAPDFEVNEMNQPDWLQDQQNNWAGPPNHSNFNFRGRGVNRGGNFNPHFNKPPRERGRGRGINYFNRGGAAFNNAGNAFRGGRGNSRGNRGHRGRGGNNFWGNLRGGF
ncbi:hypothetical protein NQ315_009269 [Exocentrus adspersus]|uniref:Uncharacterized protein n=1 Tax=Exocentrus adspersus TaxID=1586481 RepID=A0AAV8WI63_9CUCU|nr:hypothetical protein NQ315_009269 [Exocentrus adspersus]